jgi:hypothetical protein
MTWRCNSYKALDKKCQDSRGRRPRAGRYPARHAGLLDGAAGTALAGFNNMIRKLGTGEYRLYSRKLDPKTKRRRNLGTFKTRAAAEKHERAVQYFKRH